MPIKTFKGLLDNGKQKQLFLARNDGRIGYRLKTFIVVPEKPLANSNEALVKIWKTEQTTPITDNEIDWSNNRLLASAIWSNNATLENYPEDITVVFDDEIVNQDIYVTCFETSGRSMNYYIELEQIELTRSQATLATLKDIRNIGV